MKEKTSTNQEAIEVKLFDNNGIDTLLFCIPRDEEGISVNLNDTSGQNDFKRVFETILKELETKDIIFNLTIDDHYKKGLYKEVCEEYIADLNKEINTIRNEIKSYPE